ncbi:hypothetical protein JW887_04560 [Candidatus Dojkabacteria bacterium]|nr:hypothetical protein [Candidatus Dojkabacteria bacterium]
MKESRKLTLISTLLLLGALPLFVIGAQTIQDIRNKAAEEVQPVYFTTDFSKEDVNTAYSGIQYEVKLETAGKNSISSEIELGCDSNKCGDACDNIENNPPSELTIAADQKTLVWQNPNTIEQTSYQVTVTAVSPDQDNEGKYFCDVQSFTLNVEDQYENQAPTCTLMFNGTNRESIPQGYENSYIVQGYDRDDGISAVKFTVKKDGDIENTLQWDFSNENEVLINKDSTPPLRYTYQDTGKYEIYAEIMDTSGKTTRCIDELTSTGVLEPSDTKDIGVFVILPGDNGSPEYQTDPYQDSNPGTSIAVGQTYSYTVEAIDPEEDAIEYMVINDSGWINFSLNKNEDGEFRGTFSGTADRAGSFKIVLSLNDGYHDHYSTQIWVLNVDSPSNDTPVVTVVQPTANTQIQKNQQVRIEWNATDRNQIIRYDVYLATDPTNESTWTLIAGNIGYDYNAYIWNTGDIAPGTYYIVVKATDNQSPVGIGYGISGVITVPGGKAGGDGGDSGKDDDKGKPTIEESYPQVKNVKPANNSKIKENKPLIYAELFASTGNTIDEGSVTIKLDDQDITDKVEVRGEGEFEGSIVYEPDKPIEYGSHKVLVTFTDTEGKQAQKTWTFTIEEESTSEKESEDYINILGLKISKNLGLLLAIGLVIILLAIMVPWMLYSAWVRSREEEEYFDSSYKSNEPIGPSPLQSKPIEPSPIAPVGMVEPKEKEPELIADNGIYNFGPTETPTNVKDTQNTDQDTLPQSTEPVQNINIAPVPVVFPSYTEDTERPIVTKEIINKEPEVQQSPEISAKPAQDKQVVNDINDRAINELDADNLAKNQEIKFVSTAPTSDFDTQENKEINKITEPENNNNTPNTPVDKNAIDMNSLSTTLPTNNTIPDDGNLSVPILNQDPTNQTSNLNYPQNQQPTVSANSSINSTMDTEPAVKTTDISDLTEADVQNAFTKVTTDGSIFPSDKELQDEVPPTTPENSGKPEKKKDLSAYSQKPQGMNPSQISENNGKPEPPPEVLRSFDAGSKRS